MRASLKNRVGWMLVVVCLSCQIRESEMIQHPMKIQLLSNNEPVLLTDVETGKNEEEFKIQLTWSPRRAGEVTIIRNELDHPEGLNTKIVVARIDASQGTFTDSYPAPRSQWSVINEEEPMRPRHLSYSFTFVDGATSETLHLKSVIETPRNCLITKSRPFTIPTSDKHWSCRNLKIEAGAQIIANEQSDQLTLESIEVDPEGPALFDFSKIRLFSLITAKARGKIAIVSPPTNPESQLNFEVFLPTDFQLTGMEVKAAGKHFVRAGAEIRESCKRGTLTVAPGTIYQVQGSQSEYLFASYSGRLLQVRKEFQKWRLIDDFKAYEMRSCEQVGERVAISGTLGQSFHGSRVSITEVPFDAPFAEVSALYEKMRAIESVFRLRGISCAPAFYEKLVVTRQQYQLLDQLIKYRAEVKHHFGLRQIDQILIGGRILETATSYSLKSLMIPPYLDKDKSGPFMELLRE